MENIEEALDKKKVEYDSLEVPAEMEELLRTALNRRNSGMKKSSISVAVLVLVFFIISYSFDSLAFYGKKIFGYDEITYGSIQKLTEEGWGQKINKSCTFSTGLEVTLDGIIFDDNELVAFYKLDGHGKELGYTTPFFRIDGIKPFDYIQRSGHGKVVDEYTQIWIHSFEPPAFYEKWMTLKVRLNINGSMEERDIPFTLNRNDAMKRTVKQNINATVRVDQYDIKFETLAASGMSTLIEGKILPLSADAAKAFRSEDAIKGLESPHLKFDIAADNITAGSTSAGASTSNNDISFTSQFEALPETFKTLALKNIRLERLKFIDKSVSIGANTKDLAVNDDLVVKKVEFEGEKTVITVLSRGIPVMGLFNGKEQIRGENDNTFEYEAESPEPVERVFKFDGKGENMSISIKTIRYAVFSSGEVSITPD